MSKWLVNEWHKFKEEVHLKVDSAISSWAEGQIRDAQEIEKLKGEIKAIKARAGKKTGNGTPDDGS